VTDKAKQQEDLRFVIRRGRHDGSPWVATQSDPGSIWDEDEIEVCPVSELEEVKAERDALATGKLPTDDHPIARAEEAEARAEQARADFEAQREDYDRVFRRALLAEQQAASMREERDDFSRSMDAAVERERSLREEVERLRGHIEHIATNARTICHWGEVKNDCEKALSQPPTDASDHPVNNDGSSASVSKSGSTARQQHVEQPETEADETPQWLERSDYSSEPGVDVPGARPEISERPLTLSVELEPRHIEALLAASEIDYSYRRSLAPADLACYQAARDRLRSALSQSGEDEGGDYLEGLIRDEIACGLRNMAEIPDEFGCRYELVFYAHDYDLNALSQRFRRLADEIEKPPAPVLSDEERETIKEVIEVLQEDCGCDPEAFPPPGHRCTNCKRAKVLRYLASQEHRGEESKALEVVVDFLVSWRYCPVSQASDPSRSCLEDAAKQLLAALPAAVSNPSPGEAGRLRERLLSDEMCAIAGEAACRDREGEDVPWVPGSVHAMSWEGNAAAGIEAALAAAFPPPSDSQGDQDQ